MKLFIILFLCVSVLSTVHAEGGSYHEPDEYWSKCLSKRHGDPSEACRTGYNRIAKARQVGVMSGCNYWEWMYFCSKKHTKAFWAGKLKTVKLTGIYCILRPTSGAHNPNLSFFKKAQFVKELLALIF